MVAEVLFPFIDLSLPDLKVSKALQSRADAATYIAEQLIDLPLKKQDELIAKTTSQAFNRAVNFCQAATR